MTVTLDGGLEMTLPDIAALCRVQRPVVSMWRTRSAASQHPFPDPVRVAGGRPLFDAAEVVAWLKETGRDDSGEVLLDAPLFARRSTAGANDPDGFHAITSLLCLHAVTGAHLDDLTAAELIDLADDVDPDDVMLYREVASLGASLRAQAAWVARLVDAAYTPGRAFEHLLARQRTESPEPGGTLAPEVLRLVAELTQAFDANGDPQPRYADPTLTAGDLLLAALAHEEVFLTHAALLPSGNGVRLRLARRRLRTHGIRTGALTVDRPGSHRPAGDLTVLARFPDRPGMSRSRMLSAVEEICLQIDDRQRAIVIAPSDVLVGPLGADDEPIRDGVLRSGRLRAIVRLPRGLVREQPRQGLALWFLGAAHRGVAAEERWTTTVDLGDQELTDDVVDGLVTDLVAANGSRASVRAHAFRFGTVRPTHQILARSGDLLAASGTAVVPRFGDPADLVVEIGGLHRRFQEPLPVIDLDLRASTSGPESSTTTASLSDLMATGRLRLVPGNRIDAEHLGSEGLAVLGPGALNRSRPPRRIDPMVFAEEYSAGRLTEAGDVLFTVSPRPLAIVDEQGGSVAAYPVRVLRVHDAPALLPQLLADAINQMSADSREWRSVQVQLVPPAQAAALSDVLHAVELQRAELAARLAATEELSRRLAAGVAAGAITVTRQHLPEGK